MFQLFSRPTFMMFVLHFCEIKKLLWSNTFPELSNVLFGNSKKNDKFVDLSNQIEQAMYHSHVKVKSKHCLPGMATLATRQIC